MFRFHEGEGLQFSRGVGNIVLGILYKLGILTLQMVNSEADALLTVMHV